MYADIVPYNIQGLRITISHKIPVSYIYSVLINNYDTSIKDMNQEEYQKHINIILDK